MPKAPNDNQDEEEFEDLDETTEGEENSTDGSEDEDEEEESEDEGGEEEPKDEKDEFEVPEKFKGKSAAEIAKSYVELEKALEKKASSKAREMIGNKRPVTKKDNDAIAEAMKGVDFAKMKPEEFARFIIDTVEARAQEIARNTYESADNTKAQVQSEIKAVTKVWPQIKENEGFRDTVLALIENAATKGEILTLKEACAKVGKALGIKAGESNKPEEKVEGKKEEKPKPKLGVEKASGAGGGEKESDEDKIISGIMGGKTPGGLGGLY